MSDTSDRCSRKVSAPLGVGIALLPAIFAWFTLRSGHSTLSRTVSFVWLLASLALSIAFTAYEKSQTTEPYDRFADKVVMDVKYKGGDCQEPSPILVTISNNSEERIDRYGWMVSVKAMGHSTELNADRYVTSSDVILKPGYQTSFCVEIPALSDSRYAVEELEFSPDFVNVFEPK